MKNRKQFERELKRLLEKYKVGLSVSISPDNLFAKVFRKIIKIRWNIVVIDKK